MSKVYLASDHAGFALKAELLLYIGTLGHEVEDLGAHALEAGDDYPDYITPCAKRVAEEPGSFGIVIGKSGQGEAMAANRVQGARAAVFYSYNEELITLTREDNNANMLSLAGGFLSQEDAKKAVALFLSTPFSNEPRHMRRIAKF
jgi:ribose 5-phosphate isomerase B